MVQAVEAGATGGTPLEASLKAGLESLDLGQMVAFAKYQRTVLPLDGYVFWVKMSGDNTTFTCDGSLHYATVNTQDAAANISTNTMIFTAEQEVNDLNEVDPSTMWIGTNRDGLKFAFSSRGSYYEQANLFHYVGHALYADMATQIIDNPADLPNELIVSNSLPIWLYLNSYTAFYGFESSPFVLYPSFLVPDDLDPATQPYGAVDIPPELTEGLMSTALVDSNSSQFQLTSDTVRITLYGGTNAQVMDFIAFVNQYSVDHNAIGIQNIPIARDQKRTQAEFSTIAMKKMVEFQVSYYQSNVETVARKLIEQATSSFILTS